MESTSNHVLLTSGRLQVAAAGFGSVPCLSWGKGKVTKHKLSLNLDLRTGGAGGGMCDLFKLNVLMDPLPVETVGVVRSEAGGLCRARYEGRAEGLRVFSELSLEEQDGVFTVRVALRKTSGPSRRYQVLAELEVHSSAADAESMALILPRPGGGRVLLRPMDPCGQELMDQAVPHMPFERTIRLGQPCGVLARPCTGGGLVFCGDNLHWVRAWRNRHPERYQFVLYGNDVRLEQDEEWAQSFSWQAVPGLGGLGEDRESAPAGRGALLARGQVTTDERLPLYVTAPEKRSSVKAVLRRDGQVQRTFEGHGTLALDLSGLPDGAYEVVKSVESRGTVLEGCEPLSIRRAAWLAITARAGALRRFLDAADPSRAADARAAEVRADLLRWKLDQIKQYQRYHEERQVRGLLADAERVRQAIEKEEPAELPAVGALVYEHDLTSDQDDFEMYGAADLSFDPREGMKVQPVGTTHFWSRFQLDGDYRMDFDYYPLPTERGGFMVTFCGEAVNPVSQYSLMPSASLGGMDHYKYFTRTYHWSIMPGQRATRVRKTGPGFYILSEVKDVIPTLETWYRLTLAKRDNRFLFFVNERLVQEYIDTGAQGPLLASGRVGFRFWSGCPGRLRNLQISRLC